MVFSSLIFLFAFLPTVLAVYYLLPARWHNIVLFLFSLLFYGWGEPVYILLMLFSILSAYFFGFLIARYREADPPRAKRMMLLSVSVNLLLLFFFKYYNFFAVNLSRLPLVSIPVIEGLALPIGISFYTFQIISYTVDVYRGDCGVQKKFVPFGAYVTLFPQLIAGPIVKYREVDEQLAERRETVEEFSGGVLRFVSGVAKKVLIGDMLASGYVYFRSLGELSPTVLGAWLTVILYSLHLYYDFSGYSDMAIGLGHMFGFHFPENFNYPYISKSITEFWRRWHMSLSSWFREYVYIPLGGNRRGRAKQYRNLFVVWMLTGFWHGANWSFLLWGVYFAVILILEKMFLLRFLERLPSALQHAYAILLILFGFLIFSTPDLSSALRNFGAMLGVGVSGIFGRVPVYQLLRLLPLLLISVIGATPLPRRAWERMMKRHPRVTVAVPVCVFLVTLLCTA
ncbi:MAG: MBOAT family protein, partial [Clostridia bacterium]|nr:MBOAT family protein [Clostridia bacterium]